MPRFSEAISEGDGISIIPVLTGDVSGLAAAAEDAGAEAVAVASPADAARARDGTDLPVVVRGENVEAASGAGADACILAFDASADEPGWIDEQYALARDLGLDCPVDVRDEEALERVLERVDPDIILISQRGGGRGEEDLERTLDLLPDVPAGKLVISESRVFAREQVLALERAGIDAVLVAVDEAGFADAVAELTGRAS